MFVDASSRASAAFGPVFLWTLGPILPNLIPGDDTDPPIIDEAGEILIMSNTAISLCSMALVKLGDDPITALTDNTNRARHCNRLFNPTRRAVLRDAVWNDSLRRTRLAQLATAPTWEYAHAYALPVDCVRVVATSLDEYKYRYKVEGRTIVTDQGEVYLLYVYDNKDISTYDSLHSEALVARLAYELAIPITGKRTTAQAMWAEWEVKRDAAKMVDGIEDTPDNFIDDTFLTFRQ